MCREQAPKALNGNEASQNSLLSLRYAGQPRMCVRGSVTGRLYQFSAAHPVQPVDPRDAQPLLASRIFEVSL
jgi:hypothetical protein